MTTKSNHSFIKQMKLAHNLRSCSRLRVLFALTNKIRFRRISEPASRIREIEDGKAADGQVVFRSLATEFECVRLLPNLGHNSKSSYLYFNRTVRSLIVAEVVCPSCQI